MEGERGEEDGLEDEEESYFSVTSSGLSEVDYLGESTRGDLNVRRKHLEALGERLHNFKRLFGSYSLR